MEFASKAYFLLLLLLIPYILWYFLGRKKSEPTMRMSDTRIYQYAPKNMRVRLIHLPMVLRCICFVLIVIAMARPQTHYSWDNKTVEAYRYHACHGCINLYACRGPEAKPYGGGRRMLPLSLSQVVLPTISESPSLPARLSRNVR